MKSKSKTKKGKSKDWRIVIEGKRNQTRSKPGKKGSNLPIQISLEGISMEELSRGLGTIFKPGNPIDPDGGDKGPKKRKAIARRVGSTPSLKKPGTSTASRKLKLAK